MDYWDYLKKQLQNVLTGEYYKKPVSDYAFDTHPSETQFKIQKLFGIAIPQYADYMRSKSQDEYNDKVRDMYDIDYDDITYPWLSNILSNDGMMSIGSGAWEYSRNLWKLYK